MTTIALANALLFSGLTTISIAMPSVARDLQASSSLLHWVTIGALLPMALFSIVSGRLGDAIGRRRVFLTGMGLFGLASLACALSPSAGFLIGARLLQGTGCALAVPLALSNLAVLFPPNQRGWAFGVVTTATTFAGTMMPLLAGVLIDQASWRWVFLVNVPASLVVIKLSLRFIPESYGDQPPTFDALGCVLLSAGLFLMIFSFERWSDRGASDFQVAVPFLCSLLVLAAFGQHELRTSNPLLDLHALRSKPIMFALIFMAVAQCLSLFVTFNLALFLELVEKFSPVAVSAVLAAGSIGSVALAPYAGRIADRGQGRYVLAFGLAAGGVGTLLLLYAVLVQQYAATLLGMTVLGLCPALVYAPASAAVVSSLAQTKKGVAAALTVEARQLGANLGMAGCHMLLTSMEWKRRRALLGNDLGAGHDDLDKLLFDAKAARPIGGRSASEVDAAVNESFTFGFVSVLILLAAVVFVCALLAMWAFESPRGRRGPEETHSG